MLGPRRPEYKESVTNKAVIFHESGAKAALEDDKIDVGKMGSVLQQANGELAESV